MSFVDIFNDRGDRLTHGYTLKLFIEVFIEAEDAVGDSEFQKLDESFHRELADNGETVAGRNLEVITCIATGTGTLVKRVLTSNKTKVSSSAFIVICLMLYAAVPQAETIGHKGMLVLWNFRKTIKSCYWGIGAMRS